MKIRQIITVILILFALSSCDDQPENLQGMKSISKVQKASNAFVEIDMNYKEVKQKNIDSLLLDICSTRSLEFIDFYLTLDSIASDKYENLKLVDLLKKRNFKVTNLGRGNWMEGPRVVSFTMSNRQCECQIDKLYYSTDQEGKYKVTERIKCNKANR